MNRGQIFAAVMADLNREDKADRFPEWLASAEFRINQKLRHEKMVTRATLPITERLIRLPPDFLKAKPTLNIRAGTDPTRPGDLLGVVKYLPPDQMAAGGVSLEYWGTGDWGSGVGVNAPGLPLWFTTHGMNLELNAFAPTQAIMLEMWYYGKLSPLPADQDYNWLTQEAPHIYIEAIKHFGFKHLGEDDRGDRCLVTMTGEIDFLNMQNEELNMINAGPLIKRPVASIGARYVSPTYGRRR